MLFTRKIAHKFYFIKDFLHLLNHNLKIKMIHFHCLVQIPCVFIKFIRFPMFSLPGKIDNQIPCFVCAEMEFYFSELLFKLSHHDASFSGHSFLFNRGAVCLKFHSRRKSEVLLDCHNGCASVHYPQWWICGQSSVV